MNVLVTGGYGFIGSFVAEKFYREGHKVFILDNLSNGKKSNISFKHQFSTLDVEHAGCEEIFRLNKFDIVIHLAGQADIQTSQDNPVMDTKTNVFGLSNMLHLSQKFGVRKFVFASSAAVYGNNDNLPSNEQDTCNPISPNGLNMWVGEKYCKKWSEMYNLETLCLRISNVFGPRQSTSEKAGVISTFLDTVIKKKPVTVYGDGTQTRDFIYVEDVAEAIYRSVLSDVNGVINLSSNEEIAINELINQIGKLVELPQVVYKDGRQAEIYQSWLDNSLVIRTLDWVPKYSFQEGLEKTYQWYAKNRVVAPSKKKNEAWNTFVKKIKTYAPYLENGFLFLLTVLLELTAKEAFNSIDFKLIYILFIGIWLGKSQSILASGLTIVLYVYDNLSTGRELLSLFMDDETILNFAIYIFLGIVSGYVVDKKNAKEQATRLELEGLQGKHSFLTEIYHETRLLKDDLQLQIINSEDSIGKVYSIVKKLDSLETEQIFAEAISVLEQSLKSNEVAIYVLSNNRDYLRLVSNSRKLNSSIPRSLKIQDNLELEKVVTQNNFYFNRNLQIDNPIIMAPIIKNDSAIAVICVYQANFEQLTLNYQNLLKVTVNLISNSISRAFDYLQATVKERYIEGTMILKPAYFKKLVESKITIRDQLGIEFSIIEIPWTPEFKQQIQLLENSLRATDYLGMNEHGHLFVLFSNTTEKEADIVIRRIHGLNINVNKLQKDLMYV